MLPNGMINILYCTKMETLQRRLDSRGTTHNN